jgi:hypothetical protein
MKNQTVISGLPGKRMSHWPVLLLGLLGLALAGTCPALDSGTDFNHDQTGYALDFKHATVRCESCHVQAIFAGTPRRCDQCHSTTGLIRASAAPSRHIRVTGDCDYCHQPNSWLSVTRVDHFAVAGSCQSCHDGVTASGKNSGHIQSSNVCDDCHRSFSWKGAVFDHSNVSGNCSSCHNGVIADGKNPSHIQSTNGCGDCHNTYGWTPVLRVDHGAVLGSCFNCHNGIEASGKNSQHVASGNDCELCHNSIAWLPAGFVHQSPGFPGEHRSKLDCTDCHVGTSQAVAWTNAAYQPDCAGCHAGSFESGPHKKYQNPDVSYSVSELRDCSGACHIYTDSSLTTIKEIRNGEHRVSDGNF